MGRGLVGFGGKGKGFGGFGGKGFDLLWVGVVDLRERRETFFFLGGGCGDYGLSLFRLTLRSLDSSLVWLVLHS